MARRGFGDVARRYPAEEVVPGMILAEGIVIEVEHCGNQWFYGVPKGDVYCLDGETVQVYGRLDRDSTAQYVAQALLCWAR